MFENQLQALSIQSPSNMSSQTQNSIKKLSKVEEGKNEKAYLPEEAETTTSGLNSSIMRSYFGIKVQYGMERSLCQKLELKGIKPHVCQQHNRVVVMKCLNCPKNENYLCCICMDESGKHKRHKAKMMGCSEKFEE